jgi:hypothetical protein
MVKDNKEMGVKGAIVEELRWKYLLWCSNLKRSNMVKEL